MTHYSSSVGTLPKKIPRLVIAGVASGVGKTTFAVGLGRALVRRGLRVAMFKCGPDYLDPTYLKRATGFPAQTLDGWMMGRDGVVETFRREAEGADVALVEGMMGLFDGASATREAGSTAEIAKWLGAPVVLVLDASGMARSSAALLKGFAEFDKKVRIAGVICNRIGGRGHLEILERAIRGDRTLGGLPGVDTDVFPERHLGLRTASREAVPERQIESWADRVEEWVDVDRVLAAASEARWPRRAQRTASSPRVATRVRIGFPWDESFHFYYPDNMRRLARAGAELVRFSARADESLPDVDGLYFGGGYPEVFARELAANRSLRKDVRTFAESGRPIYGECGGFMYLCSELRAVDGGRYPMTGTFPLRVKVYERLRAIGYVQVRTAADSSLGSEGSSARGHQFRYSELEGTSEDVEKVYRLQDASGASLADEGYRSGSVLGSYIHLHWASNPKMPVAFVESVARS